MKRILLALLVFLPMLSFAQFSGYSSSYPNLNGGSSSDLKNNTSSYGTVNSNVRYQNGYTRKDGTTVTGHYKTENNGTNHDNYSTSGNVNPYTGSVGSRAGDYSSDANNYGAGNQIYTGPRGGQYYTNSKGNKTYVPKRNRY
jgi:hypothetical protein